ncbi:hypothetical protein CBER1_05228 [Cercospora berteroae]|uniref:Uncharacterized protein n=1 Tax=Cercospora berteroae TaxID=357750 RepID=A0A2S6BT27_9PEZI|nr:hypothetical protein CBER1_05228 [Cercospora berteroae]
MTKPQHKPPSRLQKRGRDSSDVAEHPQGSVVRPNGEYDARSQVTGLWIESAIQYGANTIADIDQFVLPIRTAFASNGVDPDPPSRSNAPAPATQGSDVNPLLRTTDYLQQPVYLSSRSLSVDAAANVSSQLFLGSYATAPALKGSNVDRLLCPPAPRKPSVYSGSRSGSLDATGGVSSNHASRSFATTPAFQGFSFNPNFPGPPVYFRSKSVSNDSTQTPVDAGVTANVHGAEESIGVEGVVKLVRKLPLLELVYLAEIVDFQVRDHGILRLARATWDPYARPPNKFDRARSSKMIKEGRKADERMAELYQQDAEKGKKRRRMEEARKEAFETMQESLLKLQENDPTEQGHARL